MCPLFVCLPKLIGVKCVCACVCTGMCVSKALKVYPERSSAGTLQHTDDVSSRHLKFIFLVQFLYLQTNLNIYTSLNSWVVSLLLFFSLTSYMAMEHLL